MSELSRFGIWNSFSHFEGTSKWSCNINWNNLLSLVFIVFFTKKCIKPPLCWPYPVVSHVSWGGSLPNSPPPHPMQTNWMQNPPDADPLPEADPPLEADLPGHVACDACWEATPRGQTNTCQNIILPQTSWPPQSDCSRSLLNKYYVSRQLLHKQNSWNLLKKNYVKWNISERETRSVRLEGQVWRAPQN